ncbi:unnamed protein product, partial [Ectocarpus sp. 13 AM-2016]
AAGAAALFLVRFGRLLLGNRSRNGSTAAAAAAATFTCRCYVARCRAQSPPARPATTPALDPPAVRVEGAAAARRARPQREGTSLAPSADTAAGSHRPPFTRGESPEGAQSPRPVEAAR